MKYICEKCNKEYTSIDQCVTHEDSCRGIYGKLYLQFGIKRFYFKNGLNDLTSSKDGCYECKSEESSKYIEIMNNTFKNSMGIDIDNLFAFAAHTDLHTGEFTKTTKIHIGWEEDDE
jgi:hypothetical protein